MWPAGAEHPMAMGRGPAAAAAASPSSSTRPPPLQSPVPYLFGGLAAMLGLIALSLLALACSYWKLSGNLLAAEETGDAERQQGGAGGRRGDGDGKVAAAGDAGHAGDHWREHVVVIMAGDQRPTFLATPASGRGGVDADDVVLAVEERRCVECGARSWPAGDELMMSRSEQQSGGDSGSSVINQR